MEILSPVKDYDNAVVAIKAGADAIYFSSSIFGARELAKNEKDEVEEIVKYAKTHYVKTYVTLNTIVMNDEIDLMLEELNYLNNLGVDAIILQDYAFIEVVRNMYPNLEVHCSTQMNINNNYAARFVKDLGASRVVVPRELSIEEVATIVKEDIETEVFVHGALCTSYSGICLISSMLRKSSGNRGKCAQLCRMKTTLYKNGEELEDDKYNLSLKDLSIGNDVAMLKEIGVSSLKIEGRLKQQEYVAVTTHTYRNIVDGISNDETLLEKVFNRELTKGYLFKEKAKNIKNDERVNNSGYYIGKVIKVKDDWVYINSVDLVHQDKIRYVSKGYEHGQSIDVIEYFEHSVRIKTRLDVEVGSDVYNVNDFKIKKNLKEGLFNYYDNNKRQFKITVNMTVGKPVEVIYLDKKYYSASNLESAKTREVTEKEIIKQFNKTKDYPFDFKIDLNYVEGFIRISELNAIRRNIYEDITNELLAVEISESNFEYSLINEECEEQIIYIEVENEEQILSLKNFSKQFIIVVKDNKLLKIGKKLGMGVYRILPTIIDDEKIYKSINKYDGYVVSELGSIEYLKDLDKPIISNYTLNTTNVINQQFLLKYCTNTILSQEISYDEIEDFNLKNSIGFLYGHIPVMTMKYCVLNSKKRDKCKSCEMCKTDNYEIEVSNDIYKLKYQESDKLAVMSHSPIYNVGLLDYNMSYYIKLTDEKNPEEVLDAIFNDDVASYIDNYRLKTK